MSFYLQSLIVLMIFFATYKEVNAACEVRSDGAICCHVETICDGGVCKPGGRVECEGGNSGGNGGSVVSNTNFLSIERVRAPVFEYF